MPSPVLESSAALQNQELLGARPSRSRRKGRVLGRPRSFTKSGLGCISLGHRRGGFLPTAAERRPFERGNCLPGMASHREAGSFWGQIRAHPRPALWSRDAAGPMQAAARRFYDPRVGRGPARGAAGGLPRQFPRGTTARSCSGHHRESGSPAIDHSTKHQPAHLDRTVACVPLRLPLPVPGAQPPSKRQGGVQWAEECRAEVGRRRCGLSEPLDLHYAYGEQRIHGLMDENRGTRCEGYRVCLYVIERAAPNTGTERRLLDQRMRPYVQAHPDSIASTGSGPLWP